MPQLFEPDHQYVLDHCTKYLSRSLLDDRHAFVDADRGAPPAQYCESWRFPIVDACGLEHTGLKDLIAARAFNQVTFVFKDDPAKPAGSVGIIGTFATLYAAVPLSRILFCGEPTAFWAVSAVVPKREIHRYRFVVDGLWTNDPVNPQTTVLPNGKAWSRFFTEGCAENLVLEDWEQAILRRLAGQIAPLRTSDAKRFLDEFYSDIDNAQEEQTHSYRFDEAVGEVSFIDNVLAREERHRLRDYKICLDQIDKVLRRRDPVDEPALMPDSMYAALYGEMAADHVDGWDTSAYGSPLFFLNLLRRHVCTGAFAHPKYGGNAAGAGWAYLADRYRDGNGDSLFDWRAAIEAPLGASADYAG